MEVTPDQIVQWKAEHKRVYKVALEEYGDFYYTTLKRDVYINLLSQQTADPKFDYEFETLKACILSPELPESFKVDLQERSGLGVVLLEQIMIKSGWQQVESVEL